MILAVFMPFFSKSAKNQQKNVKKTHYFYQKMMNFGKNENINTLFYHACSTENGKQVRFNKVKKSSKKIKNLLPTTKQKI